MRVQYNTKVADGCARGNGNTINDERKGSRWFIGRGRGGNKKGDRFVRI